MYFNMAFKPRRNPEAVQREIENGGALVEYSLSGNAEGIRNLLEKGTSVNAEDYNRSLFYKSQNYKTPLQCAASKGHGDCLKVLIEYGGNDW